MSVVMILLLILSMCACSKKNESQNTTTEPPTVRITFPEGYTVLQIAELLEEKGVCSAKDFTELCKTVPEGYSALLGNVSAENKVFVLEGYIFPDTYDFYIGEGAKNALSRFLNNTRSKITQQDFARAEELGYTMDEIFTLASIIQSEAGIPSEMPKVSSVFHNRLNSRNSGFPYLGSDVTRHYIEKKMKQYIEDNELEYETLFAAYCTNDGYDNKTQGLPAGPICNPGKSAIDAALYPEDAKYLYFFTDPNGGFHYNTSLSAHQSEYYSYY